MTDHTQPCPGAKVILRVVMLDTHRTYVAAAYGDEHVPYGRRLVSIPLTPEQCAMLQPRVVGMSGGKEVAEEIGDVWLETQQPHAVAEGGRP